MDDDTLVDEVVVAVVAEISGIDEIGEVEAGGVSSKVEDDDCAVAASAKTEVLDEVAITVVKPDTGLFV